MTRPTSPWARVLLLYATGLVAAAQLGKLSALAPLLVDDLRLGLTTMAWTISMLELGGATLGALAGWLAQRLGLVRGLRIGVAALAVAGLGQALAQGAIGLIAWRLLEAAGYLAVIVTAPVLLARHAAPWGVRTQALALTLWSTFVPVGLALGAAGAAALAAPLGWRGAVAVGGVIVLTLALGVTRSPMAETKVAPAAPPAEAAAAAAAEATHSPPPPPADAWCLAAAFGLFALFSIGLLGMLPTLLVREAGLSPGAAGTWTGVVSASAVLGSTGAAVLHRLDIAPRWPLLLALSLPAVLLFGVFRPGPSTSVAIALALAINILGGVFASLAFAMLPRVAGGHAGLVRANGLLAQFGASGSLLGPPAVAACVQWGGWPAAAAFGALVSATALPLAWRATRRLH